MTITVNKKTYEAGELVAYVEKLEKGNAELKKTVTKMNNVITKTFSNLTKAKEIINELLMNSYDENTREKSLNFLYPDKKEE